MKTRLDDISAVKKKISVEIEADEVDKKLDQAYRELGRRAKVPGFRTGKVPRAILERRFAGQVEDDVSRNLMSDTFVQAIEEIKTFPLGTPILEKEVLKKGTDFRYSAVVEVRPQFEVKDYLGLQGEKEKCEITDEDVQQQLEQIRRANGKLKDVGDDRSIQKDDYAVIDYEGFEQGQPLDDLKAKNHYLVVGGNSFHPEFENALVGMRKDEEAEINVKFEEDDSRSALAGKQVTFKVKVLEVKELDLPEMNDAFAQGIGSDFSSLEDLRNNVRQLLVSREEKRIDQTLKKRLLEQISSGVDMECPQVLIESETDYAIETVRQNLLRGGSSFEKAGVSEQKLREELRPSSEKHVKERLILGQIAQQENLVVEDDDLSKRFAELAPSAGMDGGSLQKYYEDKGLMDSFREQILEEKTLNYLVGHANLIETKKEVLGQSAESASEKERV